MDKKSILKENEISAKQTINLLKNNTKNSWQGRLCWNTPFICTWKKLKIKKKNSYLFLINRN